MKEINQKRRFVIVLGPHRCGTSALSGVLNHLGAELPATQMPASATNPVGYFESLRIMEFNDRLLKVFGADWRDISPINLEAASPQVIESLMQEAIAIVEEEFPPANISLLKDPRICRFVEFWAEVLKRAGYLPMFIHTHRNPLEAAASLQNRNATPIEVGLLIWLRHMLDAEVATRGEVRVFTSYKALLDDWRLQIEHIDKALSFSFLRNKASTCNNIDIFLSKDFYNQKRTLDEVCESTQVSDIIQEAFLIFEGWVGSSGNSLDYDALDSIKFRLDASLSQVGVFIRAQKNALGLAADIKNIEQSAEQLRDENTQLQFKLEQSYDRDAERAEIHSINIAELERALRKRSLEAEEWFAANVKLKQELEELQTEKSKLVDERTKLRKTVQKYSEEVMQTKQALTKMATAASAAKLKAAEAQVVVDALLASTSWKLSAPLRWLAACMGR